MGLMSRLLKLFKFFLLYSLFLLNSIFPGVSGKVSGIISDSDNNSPISGVNVILKNTTMGAISDSLGRFVILNVAPGDYVVNVSMIGYAKHSVTNVGQYSCLVIPSFDVNNATFNCPLKPF